MTTGKARRAARSFLGAAVREMARDERGNIVLIFAALLLPMVAISIGALDYGRANSAQDKLQRAIDAGLSFAANRVGADDHAIEMAFRGAFKANLPEPMRDTLATFQFDKTAMRMEASASTQVQAHVIGAFKGNQVMVEATGSLNLTPPKPSLERIARKHPEVARKIEDANAQIEEAQARIRSMTGRDIDLRALQPPPGAQIDRAEAERMMREVLRQLGR